MTKMTNENVFFMFSRAATFLFLLNAEWLALAHLIS